MLEYLELRGEALLPHLDDLGRLRIRIFREYPYLYDGSLPYEREYLLTYARSPRALVILVRDDGRPVGATTCLPMEDEGPEFQAPFLTAGIPPEEVFYFGESILLPEYRGHGVGKEFFRRREAHARAMGPFRLTVFCAVDRPDNHPLRPNGYRSLDTFWHSQGYQRHPEWQSEFVWKEIGESEESPKRLTFWVKEWPC